MIIDKLIKCFIPYGVIVLLQKIIKKKPLHINFMEIDMQNDVYHLCTSNIKNVTGDNILQISREDCEYPFYVRNHTSDVFVYREIMDNYEYNFITKSDPEYIIDVGANIGIASIFFANKYKKAKIISIEPEIENFKLLKRNTEKYPNITAINAALWNTSGEITIFDTGLNNVGFMAGKNSASLKTQVKITKHLTKAVTLDEVMYNFCINSIDILKIDIEGAEKEVFESCNNWINNVNSIIIELHERMKTGCNRSFYKIKRAFDQIGLHGEDIYLSKNNYIKMK